MDRSAIAAKEVRARKVILPVLCISMFSAIFNLRVLGPILVDISQEFEISVAAAGQLAVAYSTPFAASALFVGPLSDRYGRRRMILIGISTLALAAFGATIAPSFGLLVFARVIAGFGGAMLQPAVLASVGDYFPYSERARAMSWVISATTLSTVIGIPAGTFLAGIFTWRWIFGLLGIILSIAAAFVITLFPDGEKIIQGDLVGFAQYKDNFKKVLRNQSAIATLASTCLFGMFWHSWNTFNGAFYIQTYSLSTEGFAPFVMIQGIGLFIGSYAGGIIADRITKKKATVIAMILGGLLMTQLTTFIIALWVTAALNVLMGFMSGIRFTAGNALATEQVPAARGTMMAMNSSAIQLGGVLGTITGSYLIDTFQGYASLGLAFGSFGLLCAIVIQFFVREQVTPPVAEAL
jgi:predicted MFS family arabinose efflux permease